MPKEKGTFISVKVMLEKHHELENSMILVRVALDVMLHQVRNNSPESKNGFCATTEPSQTHHLWTWWLLSSSL